MIIDSHVHVFPDALAPKVISALTEKAQKTVGGVVPFTDGTERDTREKLREWGVDYGIIAPIATKVGQQKKINDFAIQINHGNFICYGSVHPDDPEAIDELYRIKELGLKGIKLHPDYQRFVPDAEKYFPLYEHITKLGFPLLYHAGFDPDSPDKVYGPPKNIAHVARLFPDMTVIGAHIGGNHMLKEAQESVLCTGLKNLYVDTSMTHFFMSAQQLEEAIRMIGVDHVLFATDLPWSNGKQAIAIIDSLGLTQEEKACIYHKNAERLLGLRQEETEV